MSLLRSSRLSSFQVLMPFFSPGAPSTGNVSDWSWALMEAYSALVAEYV